MPVTQAEFDLALKVRDGLKTKGLKGYVMAADDKERALARRLIRAALEAYIAPSVVACTTPEPRCCDHCKTTAICKAKNKCAALGLVLDYEPGASIFGKDDGPGAA